MKLPSTYLFVRFREYVNNDNNNNIKYKRNQPFQCGVGCSDWCRWNVGGYEGLHSCEEEKEKEERPFKKSFADSNTTKCSNSTSSFPYSISRYLIMGFSSILFHLFYCCLSNHLCFLEVKFMLSTLMSWCNSVEESI